MAEPVTPNAVVNVCRNCIPAAGHLPHQWSQHGLHVVVREIPCSGKIDSQYLLHAIDGVTHGVCVVACANGDCHLGEGNCRAEVRIRNVRRLLSEVGLEPERAELLHCSAQEPLSKIERAVRNAVQRLSTLRGIPVEPARPESVEVDESVVPFETWDVPAEVEMGEVASAA
jgi:coenzyme F420-reducing hydrogenase delta subunit